MRLIALPAVLLLAAPAKLYLHEMWFAERAQFFGEGKLIAGWGPCLLTLLGSVAGMLGLLYLASRMRAR